MAAIAITDCTVTESFIQGIKFVKIVTPATADQGDTIDVSSRFGVGCFAIESNSTDKTGVSNNAFGTSITLRSGGTDNEARTILCIGW